MFKSAALASTVTFIATTSHAALIDGSYELLFTDPSPSVEFSGTFSVVDGLVSDLTVATLVPWPDAVPLTYNVDFASNTGTGTMLSAVLSASLPFNDPAIQFDGMPKITLGSGLIAKI
ncbi:MAG: hypothetical protein AAGF94_18915 [Pseudomonadota bacterium]